MSAPCPGCGADGLLTLRAHERGCPEIPPSAGRWVESLGEAERELFWRPADKTYPVYWWRSDSQAWVCAPTVHAGIQTTSSLTDGRVCRRAGFVELIMDDRGRVL